MNKIYVERWGNYSEASLIAQLVKNLPAIQETPVRFLGWEDPMREGMETHSSILVWRIPMDRGAWEAILCVVARRRTQTEGLSTHS